MSVIYDLLATNKKITVQISNSDMDIKQVSDIHTTANSVRVLLLEANTDIKKQFLRRHNTNIKQQDNANIFFVPHRTP